MPIVITQTHQLSMRWKNGGGITREIIRSPQGSSLESFDWRISIATVHQGGAFSLFPGIDRSLAILDGQGIALTLAGATRQLTQRSDIFSFSGDEEVDSELVAGSIIDFNVMSRRGVYRHQVQRLIHTGKTMMSSQADLTLLYLINGHCMLDEAHALRPLHAGDAVLLNAGDAPCMLDTRCAELMQVQLWHQR